MGFFTPTQPLDNHLESLFIGGCKEGETKAALKSLAKRQEEVLGVLDVLRDGEEAHLLACDIFSGLAGRGFLLVTSKRSMSISPSRTLEHRDVAETSVMLDEFSNSVVVIESKKARLDFRPNDDKRLEHMIMFTVETPGVANRICAAIDQYL
jgi:hypothetical protein